MADPYNDKGIVLFGRDVTKIPCFRNSFLYGIGGGLVGGLTCFMFTSRSKLACDIAMGTFTIVTLGYWVHCRYQYSKTKFEMLKLQEMLRRHNTFEGTEYEKELNTRLEAESKEA